MAQPSTRARWAVSVVLLVLATVLAVHPAATGAEPSIPTLVAARDLPLGTSLAPGDLQVVDVPASLRPSGATDSPDDALGRPLAGAVRAGEAMTDARLVGTRPTAPGTATVPVRLADPGIAGLLQAGTKVGVVTTGAEHPVPPVANSDGMDTATVLTVLPSAEREQDGPLVLLSVPLASASALASASLGQPVTVTLR